MPRCLSGGAHGATLHVGNSGAPETLDPHQATATWEQRIIGDLFMGLVTDAADGSVIPGVAESWTISDDGLRWTFALGDHVWSDGEPVTADDFVFSLRRLFDPTTAGPAHLGALRHPDRMARVFPGARGAVLADVFGWPCFLLESLVRYGKDRWKFVASNAGWPRFWRPTWSVTAG